MRTFFKWLVRVAVTLFFLTIVLLVIAVLLKDVIAKSIAERNLRDSTGMDAKISKLEVNLGTPTVNLEGLKLYSPPEFGGETFLDLPELRIEYLPEEIRSGKLRFKTMRLTLAELHVVKNKQGKTNFDLLDKHLKKQTRDKKAKSDKTEIFGGIDTLYLSIGRVRITDEAHPRNNELIDLGIKNAVGRNLKTEAEIDNWFKLVLFQAALANAATNSANSSDRLQRLMRFFGMGL